MVTAGVTTLEVWPKTLPTPLSIDKEVALAVVNDKVADEPAVIELGEAVKDEIVGVGGGITALTVTVTGWVTVPPPLVAVKV